MTVSLSPDAREVFAELPDAVKRRAAHCIELLSRQPRMYPVRRIGLMRGQRYFVSFGFLFYYTVASNEIRISAILPGRMKNA